MLRVIVFCAAAILGVLAPQSPVLAEVLFTDDFDNGNAAGWTEFDGFFQVIDGVYNISSSNYCNDARAIAGDASWTDYTVDLDFNYAASHAAVLFRVQEVQSGCDAGKYYQFYVFPSQVGICLVNYSGGFCTGLTTASATTSQGSWHHLRLVLQGASFEAWIDGVSVLSFNGLTQYSSGQIGLKTINCCTNQYDNVVVASDATTGVGDDVIPKVFALYQNVPNPFNPTTTIKYSIMDRGQVTLTIYDAAGQLVRTLVNEEQAPQAGGFSMVWNGLNDQGQSVASGVYFYQLTAKNFEQTKKMVVLK